MEDHREETRGNTLEEPLNEPLNDALNEPRDEPLKDTLAHAPGGPHPRLWIVATPLGNVQDLSPRARSILSSAAYVLAEDTRRAMLLLKRCGIPERRMLSFHDHNEEERIPKILSLLREGNEIALVSDAGTPLISDPGYRLVCACRAEGIAVSPVPGPSAPVAALSASGLPPIPFTFLGFLPRDAASLRAVFRRFAALSTTLVFFERSDRVAGSLDVAYRELGERDVVVCRELTKTHEEFIRTTLSRAASLPEMLGEMTLVIGPPAEQVKTPAEEVRELLVQNMGNKGVALSNKELLRSVREQVRGWSGKELYALLETLKPPKRDESEDS